MTTRSYYLNRVAFTLFISFLVVLQYLNLLQEKPSSNKIHRSLFSLTRQDHTEKSLLRSLDDYYKNVKTDPQAETLAPDLMANVSLFRPRNRELDRNVSTGAKAKNGLPLCPMIPRNLHGLVKVMLGDEVPETMEDIEAKFPHLLQGGRFFPPHCSSRHRVAIIVPYRDRLEHLRTFLVNIHAFLKNQLVDYTVFIVEQFGSEPFNRAMLMNVGATEAMKDPDIQCFVFHDVDLLPEDDRNLYTCPTQPRHMSVSIDIFQYRLPYDDIFGGVSALSVKHFKEVNGFSNLFWGWGGEDDDMSNRLRQKKLYISRYPANVARYKMLKHNKDKANPERFKFLYSGAKRMAKDGLSSLKYQMVDKQERKLYTYILVNLSHLKR